MVPTSGHGRVLDRPNAADLPPAYANPRLLENGWADSDGKGFELMLISGHPQFNVGYSALTGSTKLMAGSVYHLVGTFDAAANPNTHLYVNGVVVGRGSAAKTARPQIGNSSTSYLGVLNALSVYGIVDHFQGDLSDCAVYNHALTAAQVSKHYLAGTKPGSITDPAPPASNAFASYVLNSNPAFYYRLDETSGPNAVDSSTHNSTGTYSTGGVTYGVPGIIAAADSAVQLNGSGGYVTSGQPNAQTVVAGTNPFTISIATYSTVSFPGYGSYVLFENGATESGTADGVQLVYDRNRERRRIASIGGTRPHVTALFGSLISGTYGP